HIGARSCLSSRSTRDLTDTRLAASSPSPIALPCPNSLRPPHPATTDQATIPIAHSATERTWPAVSSPEACRTPADHAYGNVLHAAGVRQPLAIPEVTKPLLQQVSFAQRVGPARNVPQLTRRVGIIV